MKKSLLIASVLFAAVFCFAACEQSGGEMQGNDQMQVEGLEEQIEAMQEQAEGVEDIEVEVEDGEVEVEQ